MIRILKLLTFIPWILYFVEIMYYRIGVIESNGKNKEKYFLYLNKNFFSSINLKEIFLFTVFLIFMQYEKTIVLEILFATIYLYLLIDFFHSLAVNCKKIKRKSYMVLSVVLIVGFVSFFWFTNHLYTTYILMFSFSIMSSFVIYLFSAILKLIHKNK